jgi:hypothetical protein
MKHRILNHHKYIMPCRDNQTGSCWYEADLCWFKHDEVQSDMQSVEIQEGEPSMINRLFSMMEHFTERMNNLENQL